MDTINRSNRNSKSSKDAELPERTGGLSRRSVLKTVPIAAGGVSAVLVSAIPAAGTGDVPAAVLPAAAFGAPLVELHVPPGVLTLEQKGAMIKGVTDVLVSTTKLPPDQAKKLWVQLFETAEGGWRRRPGLRAARQIAYRFGKGTLSTHWSSKRWNNLHQTRATSPQLDP